MKMNLMKLKTFFALVLQLAILFISGCRDINPSFYTIKLPIAPEPWVSLLGEPSWRIEWLNPDGYKQTADILPGSSFNVEIPATWANPVTAYPYWSKHNLIPGLFKPAGAIFPFDVSSGNGKNELILSWEAGIDAVFYWELALANKGNYSRIPANFNWIRFRELFKTEALSEAVCKDPWLVNWRSVAEKTTANNFDKRRLVPEASASRVFPVPLSSWYGTSPFSSSINGSAFPVRPGINVWISSEGILRVNMDAWVFIEW